MTPSKDLVHERQMMENRLIRISLTWIGISGSKLKISSREKLKEAYMEYMYTELDEAMQWLCTTLTEIEAVQVLYLCRHKSTAIMAYLEKLCIKNGWEHLYNSLDFADMFLPS